MTDEAWRRRAFHGGACGCADCRAPSNYLQQYGLIPAPRRDRSQAMADAMEEDAAAIERWRQEARALAEHGRRLAEQERVDFWRADVERYGSHAVERIHRQVDPTFELPASLRNIAGREWS